MQCRPTNRSMLCNRGQFGVPLRGTLIEAKPIEPTHAAEQRARIEQVIEEYLEAKHRRLLQQAITLCRKTEAHQRLLEFEAQAERVH
jgi:hypothetical protein